MLEHSPFLSQEDWDILLLYIQNRQVIPIVGPELIRVEHMGERIPLNTWLAPRLAEYLTLPTPTRYTSLNTVAHDYLLTQESDRLKIHIGIRLLMQRNRFEAPTALIQLAGITDFDLLISTTFDPLLAYAMETVRPGFDKARQVMAYDTKPGTPFPDPLPHALVYHILGKLDSFPDFAVWEEDYMEYLCSLIGQSGDKGLEGLFRQLRSRHLLLLGAPFSDWIVRFFIRAARGSRLTDRRVNGSSEYLADHSANLGESTLFFFNHLAKSTRVMEGDPGVFVGELFTRWQASRDVSGTALEFAERLPDVMPRHAVFISYSSDDRAAALLLALRLAAANVPVWLDRQRLQAGGNYERNLEHAVREECSFFISVISGITEAEPRDVEKPRYFHKERAWAASRFQDGFAFYIPIIIDNTRSTAVAQEPLCFGNIHSVSLLGGEPSPEFCQRMQGLMEIWRSSGRPRD